MKKITLSFELRTAIIAVTILQACATTSTPTQCAQPTVTGPLGVSRAVYNNWPQPHPPCLFGFWVTIATTTYGTRLRYTTDGTTPTGGRSGNGILIPARSGPAPIIFPLNGKTTLKAIAYKPGPNRNDDSPIAVVYYICSTD